MTLSNQTIPPLPPYAMGKPDQYRLAKGLRGETVWALKPRFRGRKHKGACAGAFGGSR